MITWLIGVCISIFVAALYAGMNTDKLFYRDPIYTFEKTKARVLDDKKVTVYIAGAVTLSIFWPGVFIVSGAAVVIAAPLYGIFKLGQKIAKRKEKKDA